MDFSGLVIKKGGGGKRYMLDITVLDKYQIKSDGMQYTIFKEKEVDPTKAPGFKEGSSSEKYIKWESMGKYASTLTRALQIVINEEIHNSDCRDLKDVAELINELENKIDDALGGH